MTKQELDRFVKRMDKRIARYRKAGKMTIFSGDIEADIADCTDAGIEGRPALPFRNASVCNPVIPNSAAPFIGRIAY